MQFMVIINMWWRSKMQDINANKPAKSGKLTLNKVTTATDMYIHNVTYIHLQLPSIHLN